LSKVTNLDVLRSHLIATVLTASIASAAQLITNPGFETAPFPAGWTSSGGTASTTGLNGSATAARLPFNTSASLSQSVPGTVVNFTAETSFQIAGSNEAQAFRLALGFGGNDAIEIRTGTGGTLQVKTASGYLPLQRKSDAATFNVPANQTVKIRVVGRNIGTGPAEYDVAWSDAGAAAITHSAIGIKAFASSTATTSPVGTVRFVRNVVSGNSFTVDDVTVTDSVTAAPPSDFELVVPAPDKVVKISGVYPHLAISNTQSECGIGAVVPWAGRLWALTYGPHLPTGSTDKLYEIASDLSRVTRPESIGGTPANRFIHSTSNQLIIGPYFIAADRSIRTLSYSSAPGRYTATAAHLTDPNRVYIFTMEDGVYDINVNDLSFIVRYPDVQGTGDNFLSGYHGKGAYTTQGRLIVANNGEPSSTYPSGVLATWDGSVRGVADPNPERMTAWNEQFRSQHCEVTGPGDIRGNANPATDPVWATGFDAKSVVLRTYEMGTWHTWRLPKGSYTHDGPHGWYTEWPRIREVSPGKRLMHMHGLFYDFPATFSSTNFAGLTPICSYEKMPVDYCTWEGQLVIGKNDTSRFSNAPVPRAQSNLWFGQLSDLANWGTPHGHGCLWLNENVAGGAQSEPFLVKGFSRGTLHLKHAGATALQVDIQTSSGDSTWSPLRTVTIPPNGAVHELINNLNTSWIRLSPQTAASNLTAACILSNPYPHRTPPSVVSDEFAALADIRDTANLTDGVIRVMNNDTLPLELAASRVDGNGVATRSGYHQIAGPMVLTPVANATAESALRTEAALTQDFGGDEASVWVTAGTAKLRLPRLDAAYDAPFASGWARGFRETVTERQLLNCQGTFYEVPRDDAGGRRRMKPIATHGKRITDFASWRGLLVFTGILDSAPASDKVVRAANGNGALWLGEVDDLWRMGEPRGFGGPWLNTSVAANTPSDAYLMYGYDRKELRLSHTHTGDVNFTLEVDVLGNNTWTPYNSFTVAAGQTFTHVFPTGYHAHWVRVTSDRGTTATAQFTYGPAAVRDAFMDWSRDWGLPTGAGRNAVAVLDNDEDAILTLAEFVLGTAPTEPDPSPFVISSGKAEAITRDLTAEDGISLECFGSADMLTWTPRPDLEIAAVDQTGVPAGFTRRRWAFDTTDARYFLRLAAEMQ
jgi:hypothetical protein